MTKEEVIVGENWVERTRSDRFKSFLLKSNIVHNNKYDYSRVIYVNAFTKVSILCNIHGEFKMKPNSHLNGQGCPECGREKRFESHRYDNKTFILKSSCKHNHFYLYDKTDYINSREKVIITCPIHGDFHQTPAEHLRGFGCIECGRIKTTNAAKDSVDDFIRKSKLRHGDIYIYDKVNYIDSSKKVTITCKMHGDFEKIANSHTMGQGCPECSCFGSKGWIPESWGNYCKRHKRDFAYLYVINIYGNGESFAKMGITTYTVFERFAKLHKYGYAYDIIFMQKLNSMDAFLKEKYLHKKYRCQRYFPKIKYPGYTESFNIDIINDFQI